MQLNIRYLESFAIDLAKKKKRQEKKMKENKGKTNFHETFKLSLRGENSKKVASKVSCIDIAGVRLGKYIFNFSNLTFFDLCGFAHIDIAMHTSEVFVQCNTCSLSWYSSLVSSFKDKKGYVALFQTFKY